MPRSRRFRRRRALALTPLIDVIFILLLFFMLTSTFARFGEIPVSTAAGGSSAATAAPVFLQLGAGTITLNGTPTGLDALPGALSSFEPDGAGPVTVLVSLGRDVTAQRLVDLLAVLRSLSWTSVTVLE
jgi:biopolymer transport protein ExbD